VTKQKKNKKCFAFFVALYPRDSTKEHIEEKIKATYGNDANISFSKDPNIMGGLSIKIGDETLDLSIRGKVNKLVNQLNF
jgi:F-type H+-transporting ATPase subunit delta